MSAAEEDSEDADLRPELSSDDFPDAQVDDHVSPYAPEDDYSSSMSDDLLDHSILARGGSRISRKQPAEPGPSYVNTGRIVPDVANNHFAEEESYYTRPNRYFGPDSTWRSWTREDRLIAETLDRLRSQNLSIHLFNSYAMKKKGEKSEQQTRKRSKGKARARSTDEDDSSSGNIPGFIPPCLWTAWPLPPDQVPRENEVCAGAEFEAYRNDNDPRPSATLEDCLISTMTRFARSRWRNRQWEPEPWTKRDMKVEHDSDDEMSEDQPQPISHESEAAETLISDSESGSDLFVSQSWNVPAEPAVQTSTTSDQDSTEPDRRPTPIADDEEARSILLPSTRHILSKLDDLLMGLHKARLSYATTNRKSREPKSSDTSNQKDSHSPDSEHTTHSATRPSRKRKRSMSVTSNISAVSSDSQTRRLRRTQLNLRDWSDVIGMAALTGWSPDVVQRASERCASLFGENMLFRTFFSGDVSKKQRPHFTEHPALSSPKPSDSDTPASPSHTEPSTVIRTSKACRTCTSLKQPCLPSSTTPGTGPCKHCVDNHQSAICTGITTKLPRSPTTTHCPHISCDRHTIPFRTSYHLQRHLATVHAHSPDPSSAASLPPLPLPLAVPSTSKRIICPVPTCPSHTKPFSRGNRLYEHLERMHPEIDVREVKRLEALRRGGARGNALAKGRNDGRRGDARRNTSEAGGRIKRVGGRDGGISDGEEDEGEDEGGDGDEDEEE